MSCVVVGLALVAFGNVIPGTNEIHHSWPYFILPGLFWAALRFTQPGAVSAIFMLAVVSIACTALGSGPFVRSTLSESLILVQVFMAATAIAALTLASAISERDRDIAQRKRAEFRLKTSERKFAAMFESAPFAICLVRMPSTLIADVNPAFVELFGFSREEVIGKTSVELGMHSATEDRNRIVQALQQTGSVRNMESRVLSKSGETLIISNNLDVIELEGQPYALVTLQDTTEQRKAEEAVRLSERRFRFLADNLPQIVWTANPDGYTDYYNERWYNFSGLERGRGGDESFTPILHPDDVQRCLDTWYRSVRTGEPYEIEYRFRDRKTGLYRWFLGRALPLRDAGHILKWFGSSTDIQDQKEHGEKLTEALRVREDFLAIAGHELKTPLAVLLMHIQSLQRAEASGAGIAKIRERLEKAAASAQRLDSLISQMLDVSRITAGRLRLEAEPMGLDELLQEVVERFREQAQRVGSNITLQSHAHPLGTWDRLRIDQILSNLLANAIKYGQGQPIDVEMREEHGEAVVQIIDRGIGIELSQQQKIFERFERAVGTREFGGFGLGLWISRQIAEASGGSIDVTSTLGSGSTFTLRLPLHPRGEQHALH
jgi:PAS domain S-box-containing protein